jgi:hypothetical protein
MSYDPFVGDTIERSGAVRCSCVWVDDGVRNLWTRERFALASKSLGSRDMDASVIAMLTVMHGAMQRFDLRNHPFCRAWHARTLPLAALTAYARQYGAFIRIVPQGWERLNEPDAAALERLHAVLWDEFAFSLHTAVCETPELDSVRALVAEATRLFASPATAAGAMYALEAQQSATELLRRMGFETHYAALPASARPRLYASPAREPNDIVIERKLATLTSGDGSRAVEACDAMARAHWDAFSAIHAQGHVS